jgi:hypothetical protein
MPSHTDDPQQTYVQDMLPAFGFYGCVHALYSWYVSRTTWLLQCERFDVSFALKHGFLVN